MKTMKEVLEEVFRKKLFELRTGKRIICNDAFLDQLQKTDNELNNHIISIPNPARLGIKDKYEAWIE